jgi:hypothetical protein
MRITAIALAALVASTLVTASAARAEVTAQPALSHYHPLEPAPGRPTPSLGSDPMWEAQELRRQISELHDSWDSLTPAQRNQRMAQLQQQVTTVDQDTRNLPPDQKAAVNAVLLPSVVELADLLRKAQTPPTSPCIFPFCLPGL